MRQMKFWGYKRGYSDIVLVISRLVLVDEFGELKEKNYLDNVGGK